MVNLGQGGGAAHDRFAAVHSDRDASPNDDLYKNWDGLLAREDWVRARIAAKRKDARANAGKVIVRNAQALEELREYRAEFATRMKQVCVLKSLLIMRPPPLEPPPGARRRAAASRLTPRCIAPVLTP
jgi:hypothetical protein